MAATAVLEQIAQNVEATIGSLTTPAGYGLTIRRARKVNAPAHLAGYIFQLTEDDTDAAPTGTDEWKQLFAVVVYVIPPEDEDVPVDTYNNDVRGTVYEAIMADPSRGGLAQNTTMRPTIYFPPAEGEFAGVTLMFDVLYRNRIDRPYIPST